MTEQEFRSLYKSVSKNEYICEKDYWVFKDSELYTVEVFDLDGFKRVEFFDKDNDLQTASDIDYIQYLVDNKILKEKK